MKAYFILFILIFSSCSRPFYIKDKHFISEEKEYKMDTDLKELVYKSIKRAFVEKKDIPDYRLLWKKHRIYVANEYQSSNTDFKNNSDWNESLSYLKPEDLPNSIGKIMFSLKSREELQKISDKTWEDFLHASFSLIKIEGNTATVKINNSWIVSKHSKKVYLSGGGYTCIYQKVNGIWEFQKIISSWIS
jgi:hypothetical protein